MKTAVLLLAMAALPACARGGSTCPKLDQLVRENPIADAKAAVARHDVHLLTLGGFVGEIPGANDPGNHPLKELPGTSDTATQACRSEGQAATVYATKYNQTILAADQAGRASAE